MIVAMTTTADRRAPGDLRGALLRAARDELAENGRAAVSLRAVARRAGVSHAAPAYAFGDRAGMLAAVAAQGFRELAAVMDSPQAAPGPEGLADLGLRYVRFATDHPALYELMFRPAELAADDPALEAARAASLRALTRLTREDGADAPPSPATLVSWAFAHGTASLVAQGALPAEAVAPLVTAFATSLAADG
jgi:AcrR family transcriptional regulator